MLIGKERVFASAILAQVQGTCGARLVAFFFKAGEARNTLYHLNLITLTDKQRNKVDTDQERDPCPNFLGWLQ